MVSRENNGVALWCRAWLLAGFLHLRNTMVLIAKSEDPKSLMSQSVDLKCSNMPENDELLKITKKVMAMISNPVWFKIVMG
jgi:hypothetical protein